MEDSRTVENSELSPETIESIEDIKASLVLRLIDAFDTQMRKRNHYLDDDNRARLNHALMGTAGVKVTISANITEEKLEDMYVFLTDMDQTQLQTFEEVEHKVSQTMERGGRA